ncbi:MAG: hypothetical protein MZV63_07730 [Marinilabiliales bacterium]|nr:hypothetical protein [Marinilabiliales bacterium]
MLADAGIPLGSQTVLLKGVNDDPATMKSLMHKLLMVRVRPYYIYQCDLIPGSSHFRTNIETGIDIIREPAEAIQAAMLFLSLLSTLPAEEARYLSCLPMSLRADRKSGF